jgi:hypothetical protein
MEKAFILTASQFHKKPIIINYYMVEKMHPYATNSNERKMVPLWLAAISILVSWLLHIIFETLNFSPPWWSDIPSFIGFYELSYALFNRKLWKIELFRKLGLVKTPDLNGTWGGHTISSYDNHEKQTEAIIEIFQTWTELKVKLVTGTSVSYSQTASIISRPDCAILSYDYVNEPKSDATKTMHSHRGMAWHEHIIEKDRETLNGSYFTGRDRKTFGTLIFSKLSS